MINVQTYDLTIKYIDGSVRMHYNVSRVAVKRYKEYYPETLMVDRIIISKRDK